MDTKIKYPRTYHLPHSDCITSDDKRLDSDSCFLGKKVVVTEKMDGENSTLYSDYFHSRSLTKSYHESRTWLQNFHGSIKHLIPQSIRICGENLYAKHSIHYKNLESYFLGFSVWENDLCLSWSDTEYYFNEIGISSVPILYIGTYDDYKPEINPVIQEGYVVRLFDSFTIDDFKFSVAKYVRPNHIQTTKHWSKQKVIKNILNIVQK